MFKLNSAGFKALDNGTGKRPINRKKRLQITIISSGLVIGAAASGAAQASSVDWGFEVKGHYRSSEENRFATQFPFPPEALPVGEDSAFIETVDAGDHLELSMIALSARWRMAEKWQAQIRFEGIDKYERNPTSTDHEFGIDTVFLRYGERPRAMQLPAQASWYSQVGKFPKMERQHERRTESYGLVSTAMNRFEDSGFETGFDLPSGYYAKLSWTTGNPVFMRDPNALAGDNGTPESLTPPNPNPELKSGIVILYDAEIEDFKLDEYSEYGAAMGYRFASADQRHKLDVMAFGYQRKLGEDRSLHGTVYGTDLDLFDLGEVPGAGGIRLPAEGDDKTEYGVNLWYEHGGLALFAQIVEQSMAELDRLGTELELSYVFDWPMAASATNSPIKITPVIRYSELNNDFVGTPNYPAPSLWWNWRKFDYGINVDFSKSLRLILEYSDNQFEDSDNLEGSNNETLLTLQWRYVSN